MLITSTCSKTVKPAAVRCTGELGISLQTALEKIDDLANSRPCDLVLVEYRSLAINLQSLKQN